MRLQALTDSKNLHVWLGGDWCGKKGKVIFNFSLLIISRVLLRSMIAVFLIFPNSLWRCHGATSTDFELHTWPATGSKTAFHPIPANRKWKCRICSIGAHWVIVISHVSLPVRLDGNHRCGGISQLSIRFSPVKWSTVKFDRKMRPLHFQHFEFRPKSPLEQPHRNCCHPRFLELK